jgi:Tol biopolymer transport system component
MTRTLTLLAISGLLVSCGGGTETEPAPTLLTPADGNAAFPRFSPDGKKLVFWDSQGGRQVLTLANADGTDPRRLASTVTTSGPVVWSSNNKRLAFVSDSLSAADIWMADAEAGSLRRLTEGAGLEFPFNWSPGGDRLEYLASGSGGTLQTFVLDLASGKSTPVFPGPGFAIGEWSPDGSRMGVAWFTGGKYFLGFADSTGVNARQVTTEGFEQLDGSAPAWSPDGRGLMYTSRRTGKGDVWVLPADGGSPRQLTRDVRDDWAGAWSPDGSWVAFLSNRGGQRDVWLVPSDGGTEVRVTNDGAEEDNVQWIPGTTRVAYTTGSPTRTLWTMDVTTGRERQLTPDSLRTGGWNTSPDGKEVVYEVQRGGGVSEIWLAPIEGGAPKLLVGGGSANSSCLWSPDGSRILFLSNRGGNEDIYVINPTGGDPIALTNWPTDESNPNWSLDGKEIYFLSGREASPLNDVWAVPSNGGEPRRVTRTGTVVFISDISRSRDLLVGTIGKEAGKITLQRVSPQGALQDLWAKTNFQSLPWQGHFPGGDSVVASVEAPGGSGSIVLNLKTGASRSILNPNESAGPISPDGSSLLYFVGGRQGDMALLNLKDGSTRRLTTTPADEQQGAEWLADNKTVVFVRGVDHRRIAVVDVASLLKKAK